MADSQHFGPGTALNLSILKLARMKSKHFWATTVRQLSEIRLPSEQRGGMLRTGKVLSSFLPAEPTLGARLSDCSGRWLLCSQMTKGS